jgi:hypothetical protein
MMPKRNPVDLIIPKKQKEEVGVAGVVLEIVIIQAKNLRQVILMQLDQFLLQFSREVESLPSSLFLTSRKFIETQPLLLLPPDIDF